MSVPYMHVTVGLKERFGVLVDIADRVAHLDDLLSILIGDLKPLLSLKPGSWIMLIPSVEQAVTAREMCNG